MTARKIAIVDYGMGNLFSVQHACMRVGGEPYLAASGEAIRSAEALILPGVGAFGDAMHALFNLNLITPVHEFIQSGRPFMGICLGMQLLMTHSHEFGRHEGLGVIQGEVRRLTENRGAEIPIKVPQIGWNSVQFAGDKAGGGTMLDGIANGDYLYFVHSYYVQPEDPSLILTSTHYGDIQFCSSIQRDNIFACQFHPERSGEHGLTVYRNFIKAISS